MWNWLGRLLAQRAPLPASGAAPEAEAPVDSVRAGAAAISAGDELLRAGRLDEARDRFDTALRHDPESAQAHHRLGCVWMQQGNLEEAGDCLVLATTFDPGLASAHRALALVEHQRGDRVAALASLQRALDAGEPDAALLNLRGAWLAEGDDVANAIACFRSALEIDPEHASAHANLGFLLVSHGEDPARGEYHIERACELDPHSSSAQCNRAMLLVQRGDAQGALELCDRLLAADPELHEARLNRALAHLQLGHFAAGWDDYEARHALQGTLRSRNLPAEADWQGQPLTGRTVTVYGEQGLGDQIMFASCLPQLLAEAAQCEIHCDPRLQALFQRSFPSAAVKSASQHAAPAASVRARATDIRIGVGSLPCRYRRSSSDFPMHEGYLVPNAASVDRWRERLVGLGPGLKVGISWRGGTRATRGFLRSIDLARLAVLNLPGCRFVDLQYGDTASERGDVARELGWQLNHWPEGIDDIDQCAALVAALDLVVTVQTAVAHLAGALGKPVWIVVPVAPEWRYMAREDTLPWYPSARLFRQPQEGDWSSVIGAVEQALRQRLRELPC